MFNRNNFNVLTVIHFDYTFFFHFFGAHKLLIPNLTMKKFILSVAVFSGIIFFAACSDDDQNYGGDCYTCQTNEEGNEIEVCLGENGNVYSGGIDTGYTRDEFFDKNCLNEPGTPNNPGGGGGCVTCDAYEMGGISVPAEEVCESDEGTAVIGGEDTGMPYDQYIQAQEIVTDCD